MDSAPGLCVVFACERLLPAVGGAERFMLECVGWLARRHEVHACCLPMRTGGAAVIGEPPPGVTLVAADAAPAGKGYWATKREQREAVGRAVAGILARHGADVVVTQLHSAPAVVEVAHDAGVPVVLLLPSYEGLCKYAFDTGSRCRPESGCRDCPRAAELDASEAAELRESRQAHKRALTAADRLVAPSRTVAEACATWTGREPEVIPPVTGAEPLQPARVEGFVLLAASRWNENKGVALLEPLCRALGPRGMVVTEPGLPDPVRDSLRRLDHVRMVTGTMDQLLPRAGALLVPSQWPEPFGRVAFEGLAAGVPTLASAVGGLAEFVPPGQLVAPAASVRAWVRSVRRLEEPAAWEAARRAGVAAARALIVDPPLARLEAVVYEATGRDRDGAGGLRARG
jgi:glycosyltransferase involved in cell wall biosynthesis